ncbi:MAG: 3'-5' exonuclease [Oscillospiraceae bacterium]|nr:3'-5' exonuclease [Oscillospiraceae bacterium]
MTNHFEPKKYRYIAFDVETPNHNNDRMSAIGISVIENGEITDEFYSLVNPETFYDPFNVQLTGISEELTANQPTFSDLWETIGPKLSSGILVAHNAPFDLSVLNSCLRTYGISWQDSVPYVCTVQMSRKLYPNMRHNLNVMCDFFDIDLDHHNAGSDSHACGELLLRMIREGADISRSIRTYSFSKK